VLVIAVGIVTVCVLLLQPMHKPVMRLEPVLPGEPLKYAVSH